MPARTWYLVADAARARVLEPTPGSGTQVLHDLEHPASRLKGSDLMADDRGRSRPRNRSAARGGAMDYRTPPREVEAQRFAREVAELLRLARTRNEYDELILVAAPAFLGELRGVFDDTVSRSVRAAIAKDYTQQRPDDVVRLVDAGLEEEG